MKRDPLGIRDQFEYNVLVVAVGSATLLACAGLVCARVFRWWWTNRVSGLVPRLRELTDYFKAAPNKSFSGQAQYEEFDKRRLAWARWLIPWGLMSSMPLLVVVVVRALASFDGEPIPREFADELSSFAATSVSSDLCVYYVCLVIFVMWINPNVVTSSNLDAWYSLLMAGLVWQAGPTNFRADVLAENALNIWIIAFGFSVFNLHLKVNMFWLFALNASACVTLLFGETEGRDKAPFAKVLQLTIATAMWAFILNGIHYFVSRMLRAEMETMASRKELAAARAVLRGVCDVVVELDESLIIQGGGAALGDMLLLNQRQSTKDQDIRNYMSTDEDREKFAQHMSGLALPDPDGEGMCAAFHLNMKDSGGIPMNVEVFSVRFEDRNGEQAFFVGIREFADGYNPVAKGPAVQQGASAGSLRPLLRRRVPNRAAGNSLASLEKGAADAHEEDAASSASVVSSISVASTDDATAVYIDFLSADYSVAGLTAAFRITLGEAGAFLQLMKREERDDFLNWAQEARFTLESPQSVPAVYDKRILLMTPHLRRQKLAVSVLVEMDLVDVQQLLDGLAPTLAPGAAPRDFVRLVFSDIRWMTHKPGKRRRKPTAGGMPTIAGAPESSSSGPGAGTLGQTTSGPKADTIGRTTSL